MILTPLVYVIFKKGYPIKYVKTLDSKYQRRSFYNLVSAIVFVNHAN